MGTEDMNIWHVSGVKRIEVDIVSESPHKAAEQFRKVNGYLPETIDDGCTEHVVLGECERCDRAILEGDIYGCCQIDSTLLCNDCLEETTESVDDGE